MSVDLYVTWEDGRSESVCVAGQRTAADVWGAWAREEGLKHYDGVFPIFLTPANIAEVVAEFRTLRARQAAVAPEGVERLDRLIGALERLERTDIGWEASLG